MGLFGGGGGGKVELVPLTSKSQQSLEAESSSFLLDWLRGGLPQFPGQLTPEIPGALNEAFADFTGRAGEFDSGINSAIQDALSGKPAINFDPIEATALFQESFYTPMINMFRDIAVPAIRESLNVPGAAFSSNLAGGVQRATEDFASRYLVQPFYNLIEGERTAARTSAETAEARRLPAAQFATQQPAGQFNEIAGAVGNLLNIQQQPLSAAYQEYLRTRPEAALPQAIPLSLTPTSEAFYKPKSSSGFGQIAGTVLGGIAGGPLGSSIGSQIGGVFSGGGGTVPGTSPNAFASRGG